MYKDETRTANSLRMHYIAVLHGLQITFSFSMYIAHFCFILYLGIINDYPKN